MLGENLLRFNKNRRYISLDSETEGLNLFYSRPQQLSWIIYENGKVIQENNRYLWWEDFNISKEAAAITRFNYDYYKEKAEDPLKVYTDFAKDLYDTKNLVLFQNGLGFDIYIINTLQRILGFKSDFSYLNRCYDTLAFGRAFKTQIPLPAQKAELLAWQVKLVNYRQKGLKASLGVLCKDFDIEFDSGINHEAIYDIKKTTELFEKMIWSMEII